METTDSSSDTILNPGILLGISVAALVLFILLGLPFILVLHRISRFTIHGKTEKSDEKRECMGPEKLKRRNSWKWVNNFKSEIIPNQSAQDITSV